MARLTKRLHVPFSALLVAIVLQGSWSQPTQAEEPTSAQVLDTGSRSPAALAPETVSKREQWTTVPEDTTDHAFKGDLVLWNGKLAIVLRQGGRGAEIYTVGTRPAAMRAELVAVGSEPSTAFSSVKIVENNAGSVAVDATFKTAKGEPLTIGLELKAGQVFVQTQPRAGATGLRVEAPCRFAVLPDFFADDMVIDASSLTVPEADLPSENFLLHMIGDGDAIVMAVWHPAKDDVHVRFAGEGKARTIAGSEIRYASEGKICIAVLSGPGIWHLREIAPKEADKIIPLKWKAPYTAHWRVDWQREDDLTDSWEMLTQKPDGEYVKHGWYGQVESFGNSDWLQGGRKRWTTVLGFFLYPCWIDKDGAGFLQPFKKPVRFQGPALIYPINRLEATPIEEFTIVDIMRATLGVGPCEYVLDVEGQKKTYQGRPTCASRAILNDIYANKEQKQKREEVLKTLDEVIAFVRHIRGRIGDYVTFSHDLMAYLDEQRKARPELAKTIDELRTLAGKIDSYTEARKRGIKTPEYATQLVDEFRSTLVGYEGDDAQKKCERITAALVDIGGNQDELVGECRMVVKILRQRAALAMTADPRMAPIAKEVRHRTQQMLRNPTSYEAPRH